MRTSGLTIAAVTVLAVQAGALLVIAVIELLGLSAGTATSLPSALGLIGLTVVGAIGLAVLAAAVLRGHSIGRSGGMVVQILAIAIGLSSSGVRPFPTLFVCALVIPGVIGTVLLILLTRGAASAAAAQDQRSVPPPSERP